MSTPHTNPKSLTYDTSSSVTQQANATQIAPKYTRRANKRNQIQPICTNSQTRIPKSQIVKLNSKQNEHYESNQHQTKHYKLII